MIKLRQRAVIELEVLLAMALMVLILSATFVSVIYAQQSTIIGADRQRAVLLAGEGLESVANIRDGAWNELKLIKHREQ